MRKILVGLVFVLTGCGAVNLPWDSDEEIARAAYHHPGPSTVTLVTDISNQNGHGGHSALLISGTQRTLYDPAGSWYEKSVPERADSFYGMTPAMWTSYTDYHASKPWHVVLQTVVVSRETADSMARLAQSHGASANGLCSINTAQILGKYPQFAALQGGLWPHKTMASFATLPGVKTKRIFQDDEWESLIKAPGQ
jgi:hypothetical protein